MRSKIRGKLSYHQLVKAIIYPEHATYSILSLDIYRASSHAFIFVARPSSFVLCCFSNCACLHKLSNQAKL